MSLSAFTQGVSPEKDILCVSLLFGTKCERQIIMIKWHHLDFDSLNSGDLELMFVKFPWMRNITFECSSARFLNVTSQWGYFGKRFLKWNTVRIQIELKLPHCIKKLVSGYLGKSLPLVAKEIGHDTSSGQSGIFFIFFRQEKIWDSSPHTLDRISPPINKELSKGINGHISLYQADFFKCGLMVVAKVSLARRVVDHHHDEPEQWNI